MNPNDNRNPSEEPGEGQDPSTPGKPQFARGFLLLALILAVLLAVTLIYRRLSSQDVRQVGQTQFEELLRQGKVESAIVKDRWVIADLTAHAAQKQGVRSIKVNYPANYTSDPATIDRWRALLPKDKPDALQFPNAGMLPAILVNVLPLVLLILLMVYFLNRQMRMVNAREGGFPFLKSNVRMAHKERPDVAFDDAAGVDEAKEELVETVEFLKDPAKFQALGARIPRGILLVGHPGTGKTLLARATAGEADVPFFSLCGSDFVELFVGVGAARVRDLFQRARENQPCIIFLDEIDAVGRKRGAGLGGGHDEREQTLNAILSEMDGFSRDEGIIVMAATNRSDILDPALLRPGRFDRMITVDLPDLKGRKAILDVHGRKVTLAPGTDMSVIARGTPGCSGADLEAVVNEAALLTGARGKSSVGIAEMEEARDKVLFGREKKSRVMSENDRRITAYHEAGHALVALLHPDVEPLHKVTIIPRGPALGLTMTLPEEDRYNLTRRECVGRLLLLMSGRVTEGLFCDDVSAGAQNDIQAATKLARRMVTQWGMSERIGPICYSDEEEHIFLGNEISRPKHHGEQVSQQIDEEVKSLVQQAHQDAEEMCRKHSESLKAVAEALLQLETLSADEVRSITEGRSPDDLVSGREAEAAKEGPPDRAPGDEMPEGPAAGDMPTPAGSPA